MSETIAKIIAEQHAREFQITAEIRAAINVEKRTVELSFSSENPVPRWYGKEILSHESGACDLARARSAGPLLLNHDPEQQIGVIESCEVDSATKKGRAVVRFSRSALGNEIFQDVQDGIRSLVSVGYRVREMELMKKEGKEETYRATKWEPLEISIVSIPADTSVGVGRSQQSSDSPMKINPTLQDAAAAPDTRGGGAPPAAAPATPPVNVAEVEARGANAERQRIKTATELLTKYRCTDLIPQAIEKGWQEDQCRQAILERKNPDAKPLGEAESDPNIGASGTDLKRWSITKAIREAALESGVTGIEKEMSDAVAKKVGRRANGFYIPHDIAELSLAETRGLNSAQAEAMARQIRALSAGSNTAGGFTVGTNLMSGSIIELLRNKTVINQSGARTLSGLVGNCAIPKIAGGATAYWLPEVGSVTPSDPSFGQLVLTPHRLAADTLFSKELVMQSSIDIEGLIRDDLTTVIAIAKDLAALHGTGDNGQPTGIFNTTGLATGVTFGAAATWAKILEFETNLATGNADAGALAFITSPGARAKWKAIARFSSTDTPLWTDANTVNGYPARATNQIASNKVVFGNWNDLIVAEWAGMDVVVDPYSAKKTGQIEVTMTLWTDIGVRHGASFCISSDSGAQ